MFKRKYLACLTLLFPLLMGQNPLKAGETADHYRQQAGRLIGRAMVDKAGWDKLTYLTTEIGNRLSGSPQLERAVQWVASQMKAEGLENVRLQPVKVPHWVRGEESLWMQAPVQRQLAMLGLGDSVGTPPQGITAPVVVAHSFDELKKLGRQQVQGKIVLYSVPWEGYGRTVRYRTRGPSEAAKLGAVAVLVRSATGRSIYSPHTGSLHYEEDAPKIPAAALTVEDTAWIDRLRQAGTTVTVTLKMQAQMLPDADSANVMAEITGSEKPQEVVVFGGHIDSWDVGQGAHDDGASCMAAWEALTIMKQLGLRPRRTVRVVLWTNEENGARGGKAYREALGEKVENHVAAIEMDGGAERPLGFGLGLGRETPFRRSRQSQPNPVMDAALARLRGIAELLDGIDAGTIMRGGGGTDIGPLMAAGVPGLALRTVGEHYFDWHHTNADTLDKVDEQNFRKAIAMLAVMSYVLADMPGRLVPAGDARGAGH